MKQDIRGTDDIFTFNHKAHNLPQSCLHLIIKQYLQSFFTQITHAKVDLGTEVSVKYESFYSISLYFVLYH
jgi:hypothetical protein